VRVELTQFRLHHRLIVGQTHHVVVAKPVLRGLGLGEPAANLLGVVHPGYPAMYPAK
jgi:hypothetical protein